jgi:hypothetical protein
MTKRSCARGQPSRRSFYFLPTRDAASETVSGERGYGTGFLVVSRKIV